MSFNLPPIIKLAERVRVLVENAVASWRRDHRHAHGEVLRQQAREAVKAAHYAWIDRAGRTARLQTLSDAIDELKMDLRLAQHIKLYRCFGQFEEVYRAARELGQQCGAMSKAQTRHQHSRGQSAAASRAAAARPDTEYPGRLHAEANR
jgi:hypothetical protein